MSKDGGSFGDNNGRKCQLNAGFRKRGPSRSSQACNARSPSPTPKTPRTSSPPYHPSLKTSRYSNLHPPLPPSGQSGRFHMVPLHRQRETLFLAGNRTGLLLASSTSHYRNRIRRVDPPASFVRTFANQYDLLLSCLRTTPYLPLTQLTTMILGSFHYSPTQETYHLILSPHLDVNLLVHRSLITDPLILALVVPRQRRCSLQASTPLA